jgi:tetratricopeptide (TPR) repeat protein
MQHARSLARSTLMTLTLLSACAASRPGVSPGQAASAGPEADGPVSADFLIGRFAGQHGDLDRAASAFLHALASDPDNTELQQQAFLACLLTDRAQTERLARTQTDSPVAQLYLADLAAQAGRWDEAQSRFAALPLQGMTQVLQPLLLAWAQAGAGRPDLAIATLGPYVEGERFRGVYALHAAMITDLAQRDPQAARLYRAAAAEYGPTNLELARTLASWQARQGDAAAADRSLQAVVADSPDLAISLPALERSVAERPVRRATDGIAEAYLAMAAALRSQDVSDYAVLLLHLALQLRPELTSARLLSSEIADDSHRPLDALAVLAPVGGDDPLAGLVDLRRAALLAQLDRTTEALALLARMEKTYPDRPETWTMQGGLLREAGQPEQAVAAYDHAVALVAHPGRDNWPLFYARGIALEQAGHWPQAQADFQQALRLSPDQPYVLNYLGYAWTERGDNLQQARHMIERAVALKPDDGAIIDSLGWVELRQGDVAAAVRELEHAVELEPEDSTINGHLGDAYRAAHRPLEAAFQWQLALTLKPSADEAAALQKKLRDVDATNQQAAKGTQ